MLGQEPTEQQSQLYDSYPKYRGIADPTLDPKIAEAILILALQSGFAQDRVMVLAPLKHERWVLDQFDQLVTRTFAECKKHPKQIRQSVAGYTQLFKKVQLMGRLLQLPREPQYWVSFGFTQEDPLPEWMPQRLLLP
jgi:hypothetical protein